MPEHEAPVYELLALADAPGGFAWDKLPARLQTAFDYAYNAEPRLIYQTSAGSYLTSAGITALAAWRMRTREPSNGDVLEKLRAAGGPLSAPPAATRYGLSWVTG